MARQIITDAQRKAARAARTADANALMPEAIGGSTSQLTPLLTDRDYIPKPLDAPQAAPTLPIEQSSPQEAKIDLMQETGNPNDLLDTTGAPLVDPYTGKDVARDSPAGLALLEQMQQSELIGQEEAASVFVPERTVVTPEGEAQLLDPTVDFETADDLLNKPEVVSFIDKAIDKTSSTSDLEELANLGQELRFGLQDQIQPLISDNSEVSRAAKNELIKTNVINPESNTLNQTLSNAMTVAGVLVGHDMLVREDTERSQRGRPEPKEGSSIETTAGTFFSPDNFRNGLARTAFNLIGANPNAALEAERDPETGEVVEGGIRTGMGGYGDAMNTTTRSAFDAVFNVSLSEDGWFDYIWEDDVIGDRTPENASYLRLSARGESIVRKLTPLMKEMGLITEVNVSLVPTVAGQTAAGRSMETGRRFAGNISKTNKSDKNTAKEDRVKNYLGSSAQKIVTPRFSMARMMVEGLITINRRGGVVFKHPPADGNFYSDHDKNESGREYGFASTLGIGKAKWYEHYDKALRKMPEEDARNQANLIMQQKAKQLLKTVQQGLAFQDKIFYNKIMHATSVGRYFIRNTVLNPQNNKLVRMFVGNPQKLILNPKKDRSTKVFKDWAYIIGYNLLDTLGGDNRTPTEDRGWDSILNEALPIIRDPNNEFYKMWVAKGKRISNMLKENEALQNPAAAAALRAKINAELGPTDSAMEVVGLDAMEVQYKDLLQEFTKAGEWGYPFQAYLDMYNYDQALKNPSENAYFNPEVQVQHDGKQNGIAQQAMQAGDTRRLARVGAIYSDEENVITDGDMRGYFRDNMITIGIPTALKESPERLQFWTDFGKNVINPPEGSPSTREIIKAISKQPMMETSYGRAIQFNMDTASFIVDSPMFRDLFPQDAEYSRQDRIAALNDIITATLRPTLDFKHQALLKSIGKSWSMLGIVPEMLGPLGNTIFMGSSEYVKSGQSIIVQTSKGPVEVELTERKYTGSARQRQRKLVLEPGATKYLLQEQTGFGQEVANQLPVLPIQQIDAAIMAETILAVNDGRAQNTLGTRSNIIDRETNRPTGKRVINPAKGVAYVIPVHDAIITDASSVSLYHETINNKFKEINQRYSAAKAAYNGFVAQKKQVLSAIQPGKQYNVNVESNFRALHSRLLDVYNRVRNGTTEYVNEEGITVRLPKAETKNDMELYKLITGSDSSWNPEGTGSMNGTVLRKALLLALNASYIETQMTNWIKSSEAAKVRANRLINKLYTYN